MFHIRRVRKRLILLTRVRLVGGKTAVVPTKGVSSGFDL